VDIRTVVDRHGRAQATMTLNRYAHALPERDRHAATVLGDTFTSTRTPRTSARVRKRMRSLDRRAATVLLPGAPRDDVGVKPSSGLPRWAAQPSRRPSKYGDPGRPSCPGCGHRRRSRPSFPAKGARAR